MVRNYSLLHGIKTGPGAHPVGNGASLSDDKLKFDMGGKVVPVLN
jgi:hypothetical protein